MGEAAEYRHIYARDADLWFAFKGYKWRPDPNNHEINKTAEGMMLVFLQDFPGDSRVRAAAERIEKMVKRAQTFYTLEKEMVDFDANLCGLNTPEGFYDLAYPGDFESWEGRDKIFDNRFLCTNLTKVAPAERWEGGKWAEFLETVFVKDEDRSAVQRMLAYVLLGDRQDKAVFFLHGATNRGKSLFLNAVENALGDYAITTTTDVWLKSARSDYVLADLPGKRLVTCAEFDEEMRINTSLLKMFTGGELLSARMIYGKPFKFRPQGTIVVSTNKLPYLGSDAAAWGRVYVMEFDGPEVGSHQFSWEAGDSRPLRKVLHSQEVAGEILRWMIDGVPAYLREGINWPESSLEVVSREQEFQRHHVEIWIEESLEIDDEAFLSNVMASQKYREWALLVEHVPESKVLTASALGRKLSQAGFEPKRVKVKGKVVRGWNASVID